ncbi:MAG: hypothetical protein WA890_13635 [Micromonospora sp.]
MPVSTRQGGGQTAYGVDDRGAGPHITVELSSVAGLAEADESYRESIRAREHERPHRSLRRGARPVGRPQRNVSDGNDRRDGR